MFGICISPKEYVNIHIHSINVIKHAIKQDSLGGNFYLRQAMDSVINSYSSAAAQIQHLTHDEQEIVKPILSLSLNEIETGSYEFPLL